MPFSRPQAFSYGGLGQRWRQQSRDVINAAAASSTLDPTVDVFVSFSVLAGAD